MKKTIALFLMFSMMFAGISCGGAGVVDKAVPAGTELCPGLTQARMVCELAVMDCYYHTVAKYFEKDATGILLWKKDKHFWIEYSGVVQIGVDASKVDFNVNGTDIAITLPAAKVLGCKIDKDSFTEDSYVTVKSAGKSKSEDAIMALNEAEVRMTEAAGADSALLANAQERVKTMLEDYVNNIGELVGVTYRITWIDADQEGRPLDGQSAQTSAEVPAETTIQ